MSNKNNNKHNINLEKQSKTFLPRAVGLAWVLASKYSSYRALSFSGSLSLAALLDG